MDVMLLRLFQRQILLQTQAILMAAHDLEKALLVSDGIGMWVAVQNLLTAAANISKACWGQQERFADDREPLRLSLGIPDDSPLRRVVMRNRFEHFDEYLDKWWKGSTNHNYLDMSVMPPGAVQGLEEKEMFRVFDPTTSDLVFWGMRFNLRELIAAVQALHPVVSAEAGKPHWEPPSDASSPGGGGQ